MLTVENLTTGYKSGKKTTPVSQKISFTLKKGDILGIIGRNGSGKSTLLKTLAQLIPKLEGSINYDGKSLAEFSSSEQSQLLSIVTTTRDFSGILTGFDILRLGRHPHNGWYGKLNENDKNILKEVIQKIGMENLINQRVTKLSDGQLQKILIGRAMVQQTDFILLDEPTNHLDLHHKAEVFRLLKTMALEQNKTILFSTHEINHALQLCTHILLLNEGEAYFGSPKELSNKGVMKKLFPKELVAFDAENNQFKICY
ncbi:MAG: ABC transporter ATP-binding protein [Flavobacteriaceae bacterium]